MARARRFLTGREDRQVPRLGRQPDDWVRESYTLPNRAQSAGIARRTTLRMCAAAGLTADVSDSAGLLTSELVTNALVFSHGEQRVTVTTRNGGVRVEVGDDSRDLPTLRERDDEAEHGRGMQLMEQGASSWGVRRTARGKCVWFDITAEPGVGIEPTTSALQERCSTN
jgi:anti-sigma regulatory factor (Ser/Thr protein kinase)